MKCRRIFEVFVFLIFFSCNAYSQVRSIVESIPTDVFLSMLMGQYVAVDNEVNIKSAVADGSLVRIKLTDGAKQLPLTQQQIAQLTDSVSRWCKIKNASLKLYTSTDDLTAIAVSDTAWLHTATSRPVVLPLDEEYRGQLTGRTLALWASHGRYFEQTLNRWEWQRGRLFTTVEDLLTPSFVYPFLMPMLENAGCYILSPRERDTTSVCTIVDVTDEGFSSTVRKRATHKGFASGIVHDRENPFLRGEARSYTLSENDSLTFTGVASHSGQPMVYISYVSLPASSDSVYLTMRSGRFVRHFLLNEQKGGGMWIPIAHMPMVDGQSWSVVLRGRGLVSVDALRIGGGMGSVERFRQLSGMPAWAECARYYLQADGFDYDKVVSLSNGVNDYTDDVNCRGEWVNALIGDKNITVDASLAFHTDAGVTGTDSVIGTLALISTKQGSKTDFPDGRSRRTSRQYAGHVQRSIMNDLRRSWDRDWTVRGIADKGYSESRRPNVPSLLLELLSHQNLSEIRLALHPAFRFDVCRAVYKGILRYLCGPEAVATPLAPSRFGMTLQKDGLLLAWCATVDSLEPNAVAKSFIVYDNNIPIATTTDTCLKIFQPKDGTMHSYSIVALGDGGRSFPSCQLQACLFRYADEVLLVNGMDRLSAPATMLSDSWTGVLNDEDNGVPWDGDIYSVGDQYDYAPTHPWVDDDAPGCGASYADREIVPQRSATSSLAVARLLQKQRRSFISQSKEYFDNDTLSNVSDYEMIRIDLRQQRTTAYGDMESKHAIYTEGFRRHIELINQAEVPLVISGDYVGTDAVSKEVKDWCAINLGFMPRTNHASRSLKINVSDQWLEENAILRPKNLQGQRRQVDAIEPTPDGAVTIGRYADTNMSAGTQRKNVVVVGF